MTSKMKMTWKNDDDLNNEDNLKNEEDHKMKLTLYMKN